MHRISEAGQPYYDIKTVLAAGNSIQRAIEEIQSYHPSAECCAHLQDNHYRVIISGLDLACLEDAVNRLFQRAGTPSFVRNGSSEVVDKVLGAYRKILNRGLDGLVVGKHVVDK